MGYGVDVEELWERMRKGGCLIKIILIRGHIGWILLVFFFQAEDGIRDFCLSRGLGDVYKRQDYQGISV